MGDYMDDEDTSQENNKQPTIKINNTRFIFKTNFSGDPRRDKYGSSKRHANLVIPDASLAQDLILEGFNVKTIYGKNKDGSSSGVPTFYVDAKVNYNYSHPPLIYLVTGDNKKTLLDEDTVDRLDYISIENVDADLAVVENKNTPGKKTFYVRHLYVTQLVDDDPFADKYADYQMNLGAQDAAEEPGKSKTGRQDDSEGQNGNETPANNDYFGDSGYSGSSLFD